MSHKVTSGGRRTTPVAENAQAGCLRLYSGEGGRYYVATWLCKRKELVQGHFARGQNSESGVTRLASYFSGHLQVADCGFAP